VRRELTSIDDRHIMGNPYDHTRWTTKREGRIWVVRDGLGNVIHEDTSEARANRWCADLIAGRIPRTVTR